MAGQRCRMAEVRPGHLDGSSLWQRDEFAGIKPSSPSARQEAVSMGLASPRVVNIKDLRRLARARLPDAVFDYLDGAADDEVTLKDSEEAFKEVLFRPRFAVATPACDLGVTVLGQKLNVPFMLGPIGYSRLMHPRGELAASAAAGRHGTAYILSTLSGHRMEDVKAQSPGPTLYQ